MSFASISFPTGASNKLKSMQGRTGITPNLLARIGFCLSLREPYPPELDDDGEAARVIERRVLTGVYDDLLLTLLRQRDECARLDDELLLRHFKAHMVRGVFLLDKQLKGLERLPYTLPPAIRHSENDD